MGFYRYLVFVFLFCSCSEEPKKPLNFSLKNNSSSILTVIKSNEDKQVILGGFCFQFAKEDFPLRVVFGNYESSLSLNAPNHYMVQGPGDFKVSSAPCQSDLTL